MESGEHTIPKVYRESFLVGPVVKAPRSQYRGPSFDPWSGNPRAATKSSQLKIRHAATHTQCCQITVL